MEKPRGANSDRRDTERRGCNPERQPAEHRGTGDDRHGSSARHARYARRGQRRPARQEDRSEEDRAERRRQAPPPALPIRRQTATLARQQGRAQHGELELRTPHCSTEYAQHRRITGNAVPSTQTAVPTAAPGSTRHDRPARHLQGRTGNASPEDSSRTSTAGRPYGGSAGCGGWREALA